MKLIMKIICLSLLCLNPSSLQCLYGSQSSSFSSLPCWDQSINEGKWEKLPSEFDSRASVLISYKSTIDFHLFLCDDCESIRVIDQNLSKERIILSPIAKRKHCDHKWIGGLTSKCFDPLEQGDYLIILHNKSGLIVSIKEFYYEASPNDLYQSFRFVYEISKIPAAVIISSKIDLNKLSWEKKSIRDPMEIGNYKSGFFVKSYYDGSQYLTFDYGGYFGNTDVNKPSDEYVRFAIVHKKYVEDNILDPSKFRFKIWEDGLGSLCGIEEVFKPTSATCDMQDTMLDLHTEKINDMAVSPNEEYIVTTSQDGQIINYNLDCGIKKIIGPFANQLGKKDIFSSIDVSQDSNTILVGIFDSKQRDFIFKINADNNKYTKIKMPQPGSILNLYFCNNDKNIAYITPLSTLWYYNLDSNSLICSQKIFGGIIEAQTVSSDKNYIAIISRSMMSDKDNTMGKPSGPFKLTIYDNQCKESFSYEFESSENIDNFVKIVFLDNENFVICLPKGEMWHWTYKKESSKWEISGKVKIEKGWFSAIETSCQGKIIWLAKGDLLIAIESDTGKTVYEKSFEKLMDDKKDVIQPISAVKVMSNKKKLCVALSNGKVVVIPMPESVIKLCGK